MTKQYSIGIIGYGDFTKVMVECLAPYAEIIISSRSERNDSLPAGVRFGELDDVLAQPIIIPSFPAQFFEAFFQKNSGRINPNAVVIDVCSVKVKPLRILQELLPSSCQIIGTHPMFGPASIAKNGGVEGLPCALCPVRVEPDVLAGVRHYLTDILKLTVIDTTPEQHDREMAYVQGLSHYIGRVMDLMSIPESQLQTAAYADLLDMKRIQGNDSWDLFASIMHENPYAGRINQEFKRACQDLDARIELVAPNTTASGSLSVR